CTSGIKAAESGDWTIGPARERAGPGPLAAAPGTTVRTGATALTTGRAAESAIIRVATREAFQLLEAFFYLYVDAERSVLIAQPDNGDVAVHVIFHLNDLLLRRTHI